MKKNAVLELLLCPSTFKVTNRQHIVYITDQELKINNAIMEKEREKLMLAERARGPNITHIDRLRFIEAVLSDPVKILYRKSQDVMTLSDLENRNSIMCWNCGFNPRSGRKLCFRYVIM